MLYRITSSLHVSYFFSWVQIVITGTASACKMTLSKFSIFAESLQISGGVSDRITLSSFS